MKKELTFTQALKRLEEIVEKLEGEDLDIEEAVDLLTEGVKMHKFCQEKLKGAQTKIDGLFEASEE